MGVFPRELRREPEGFARPHPEQRDTSQLPKFQVEMNPAVVITVEPAHHRVVFPMVVRTVGHRQLCA